MEPRIKKASRELIPAQEFEKAPEVKLPFWKKHGFKRLCGAVLTTVAGIAAVAYPPAAVLGQGLAMVGSLLFGVGVADWQMKKDAGVDMTDNVIKLILELLVQVISLFKKGNKDG